MREMVPIKVFLSDETICCNCAHCKRCELLLGASYKPLGQCDWSPSRYTQRRAPVKDTLRDREIGTIAWGEFIEAWLVYELLYGGLRTTDTICKSGGFTLMLLTELLKRRPLTLELKYGLKITNEVYVEDVSDD